MCGNPDGKKGNRVLGSVITQLVFRCPLITRWRGNRDLQQLKRLALAEQGK